MKHPCIFLLREDTNFVKKISPIVRAVSPQSVRCPSVRHHGEKAKPHIFVNIRDKHLKFGNKLFLVQYNIPAKFDRHPWGEPPKLPPIYRKMIEIWFCADGPKKLNEICPNAYLLVYSSKKFI